MCVGLLVGQGGTKLDQGSRSVAGEGQPDCVLRRCCRLRVTRRTASSGPSMRPGWLQAASLLPKRHAPGEAWNHPCCCKAPTVAAVQWLHSRMTTGTHAPWWHHCGTGSGAPRCHPRGVRVPRALVRTRGLAMLISTTMRLNKAGASSSTYPLRPQLHFSDPGAVMLASMFFWVLCLCCVVLF